MWHRLLGDRWIPCVGLPRRGVNHSYLARARCGSSTATSSRVGEFDFALMAGTP